MNQNSSSSLPILNQVPSPVDAAATDESIINAAPVKRLPRWLKREVPRGNADHFTSKLLEELNLETVCDNAKCPNRMECYIAKDCDIHDSWKRLHSSLWFLCGETWTS